jgi:hypothetical protein
MDLEIEEMIMMDECLGMKRESPMGKEKRKMWKEMSILLVLS